MNPWTPFERAVMPLPSIGQLMADFKLTGAAARRALHEIEKDEVWLNSRYQVNIRRYPATDDRPAFVHLSIKSRDKAPVRDWREFQRIKNELVGPECEAIELYPAESRLVDTANQYHLFAVPDPSFRFPFGFFEGRSVMNNPGGGAVQRPDPTYENRT